MSDELKGQGVPEGVVSGKTETPQDVVSVDATVHVMVMRVGKGGYVRLAHWQMSGSATSDDPPRLINDNTSGDVPRARSLLGKLMKHLRGGPEV